MCFDTGSRLQAYFKPGRPKPNTVEAGIYPDLSIGNGVRQYPSGQKSLPLTDFYSGWRRTKLPARAKILAVRKAYLLRTSVQRVAQ
jgi:hypothetical protein